MSNKERINYSKHNRNLKARDMSKKQPLIKTKNQATEVHQESKTGNNKNSIMQILYHIKT